MLLASTPVHVRVEKRPEASFSQTISDICSWLDQHTVRPVVFEPVATRESGIGFELSFESEDEADSFQQECSWLHVRRLNRSPSIPSDRATASEHELRSLDVLTLSPDPAADMAALHEFREGMTATVNHLFAASRLLTASSGSNHETVSKALEEALSQAERASQAVFRLHGQH